LGERSADKAVPPQGRVFRRRSACPGRGPRGAEDTLPDGKKVRGIYELDGDTLRFCVAPPDKDRPTEFTSRKGSGYTLRVFRRVKP
jgi:hypothetical protein